MAYFITLTDHEIDQLAWMAARWEAPSKPYESLNEHFTDLNTGATVYRVDESDSWEVNEIAYDPDRGFTCLNWSSNLGEKIRKFLEEIV